MDHQYGGLWVLMQISMELEPNQIWDVLFLALPDSFRFCPNSGRLAVEEIQMYDIGIAADRAIFDVLLLDAGGWIERNDDPFAAGGADIRALIARQAALFLPLPFHAGTLGIISDRPLLGLFLRILLVLLRLLDFPLANLVTFAHVRTPLDYLSASNAC
jgi:hypothetical protein